MRWTKATRLALHAALQLAVADGERVKTQEIADRYRLPMNHLAKVLGQLVRAGIARGARGVGGGYQLARPAGEITLLEVVEAVEGPREVGCTLRDDGGPCPEPCDLRRVLDDLEDQAVERLRGVTLADMTDRRGARSARRLPVR
jgi:Rrf2 family protein